MASLNFKGKTFVQNHHLAVKYHQLVPKKDKSLTDKVSLNDNLIIHGDNLIALKSLLPTYAGKVKCVFIDPPYNTGNEKWIYNDNVNSPMIQEWLGNVVDAEDFTRHDKWLCMMMPRLKLLKELMSENGVIFITIDDNEASRLRLLLDEIYGETNFVANIVWQKKQSPQNDATYFSDMHDTILVYAKRTKETKDDNYGWQRNLFERSEEQNKRYSNPDNDERGDWTSVDYTCNKTADERPNLYYAIVNPNTKKKIYPSKQAVWRYEKATHEKNLREKRIWWGANGEGSPRYKRFKAEVQQGVVPSTWWDRNLSGDNQESRRELRAIFGEKDDAEFATPKPVRLIKRILQIATSANSEDIILDSFAGSGTTAHAVLEINQEDDGNRKFILVECENYAERITAERIRRVINGVKGAKDDNLRNGIEGTFSFFELGNPIEMTSILEGKKLPDYEELARYVFYTATGEEFNPSRVKEKSGFIGESRDYEVYLFYKPDLEYLKSTALTLDMAKKLGLYKNKTRLVFAPSKYLDLNDSELIEAHGIQGIIYCQLPFEIYKLKG